VQLHGLHEPSSFFKCLQTYASGVFELL